MREAQSRKIRQDSIDRSVDFRWSCGSCSAAHPQAAQLSGLATISTFTSLSSTHFGAMRAPARCILHANKPMPKGTTISARRTARPGLVRVLPVAGAALQESIAVNNSPPVQNPLDALHQTIDACRKCENSIPNLCKPIRMLRGTPGDVMIVGQGPGKQECAAGYAFAGQSGKRLDQWLRKCRRRGSARDGIYLTSVVKCVKRSDQELRIMVRNCRPFLEKQIALIRPKLIITLGRLAFETLNFSYMSYTDALCIPLETKEHVLLPRFGYHLTLLPWPHPSGLNRWLNEKRNRQALEKSFQTVATFLR
jgi:uracil-DNA glycosylase family 4